MENHTPDFEVEPGDEQISTPEELKERTRIKDIMTARRDAKKSFIEATEVELQALSDKQTEHKAGQLATRYVYRNVAAYVEEMAYHLRTTDTGERYWRTLSLGRFTPNSLERVEEPETDYFGKPLDDRPTPPARRDNPDPVDVVGLVEYLGMGEMHTRTVEIPGDLLEPTEKRPVKTAVPVSVSRRAFRATNHFVEDLLGLELTGDENSITNVSLSTSGDRYNHQ